MGYWPMSAVIGNQWYWTYRQGTRPEYQSTLYRGALTSTSMMTNRWAMGYWAVSSNDVIHNWRVARVSDDTMRIKMDAYPGRLTYLVTTMFALTGFILGIVQSCVALIMPSLGSSPPVCSHPIFSYVTRNQAT